MKWYEIELKASYYCTETATFTVKAENEEQAEVIAIEETRDGDHFSTSYDGFVGMDGWDGDGVELEVTSVKDVDEDD